MSRWTKVAKKTPDTDRKVIAFSGDAESHHITLAWFSDGQWWLGKNIELASVTRWMDFPGEPKDFAYWKHRLSSWLRKRVQNADDAAEWLRGWTSKNAQLDKKVVYFQNERTGEIRMGLPERFAAPKGFQKVVCGSALEAEAWSDRLRRYNLGKESKRDEERAQIEGEMAAYHRSQVHNLIANSRSKLGRDFLRKHLENMDKAEARRSMKREEYLHSEGFEQER
jgi:hypothetical protein